MIKKLQKRNLVQTTEMMSDNFIVVCQVIQYDNCPLEVFQDEIRNKINIV